MPQAQILVRVDGGPWLTAATERIAGREIEALPGSFVEFDNNNTGGEITWAWTQYDQPKLPEPYNPAWDDFLSNPAIQNPTITVNKEGSYHFLLTVNGTLIDEVIICVPALRTTTREPAAGEQRQVHYDRGWASRADRDIHWLAQHIRDGLCDLAVNNSGGALNAGDVVYVTGRTTFKTGLPGEEYVSTVDLADALTAATLKAISLVEGAPDGSTSVAAGELCVIRQLGLLHGVDTIGFAANAKLYLQDGGGYGDAPGTNVVPLGYVAVGGILAGAIYVDSTGACNLEADSLQVSYDNGISPNKGQVDLIETDTLLFRVPVPLGGAATVSLALAPETFGVRGALWYAGYNAAGSNGILTAFFPTAVAAGVGHYGYLGRYGYFDDGAATHLVFREVMNTPAGTFHGPTYEISTFDEAGDARCTIEKGPDDDADGATGGSGFFTVNGYNTEPRRVFRMYGFYDHVTHENAVELRVSRSAFPDDVDSQYWGLRASSAGGGVGGVGVICDIGGAAGVKAQPAFFTGETRPSGDLTLLAYYGCVTYLGAPSWALLQAIGQAPFTIDGADGDATRFRNRTFIYPYDYSGAQNTQDSHCGIVFGSHDGLKASASIHSKSYTTTVVVFCKARGAISEGDIVQAQPVAVAPNDDIMPVTRWQSALFVDPPGGPPVADYGWLDSNRYYPYGVALHDAVDGESVAIVKLGTCWVKTDRYVDNGGLNPANHTVYWGQVLIPALRMASDGCAAPATLMAVLAPLAKLDTGVLNTPLPIVPAQLGKITCHEDAVVISAPTLVKAFVNL